MCLCFLSRTSPSLVSFHSLYISFLFLALALRTREKIKRQSERERERDRKKERKKERRERERERRSEKKRERERETDRQTDRQAGKERALERDGQAWLRIVCKNLRKLESRRKLENENIGKPRFIGV